MKPNNLESLWMPFTPNKSFKKDPRIMLVLRICILSVMMVEIF